MSEILPKPDKPFGGKIGVTTSDSKPEKPSIQKPPEGTPNVLLEDVGFGTAGTFGGPVPTHTFGCAGKAGASLQSISYDCSLLADARRAAHRSQPSQRRNGRHLLDRHRLSGLQQCHSAIGGDRRRGAAIERIQHRHVRQEPLDDDVGDQPGWTL
jgi:hypothetical protein